MSTTEHGACLLYTSFFDLEQSTLAKMKSLKDVKITYTFGDKQEVLAGTEICKWMKAVSYTHLDVYKRQPVFRAGRDFYFWL